MKKIIGNVVFLVCLLSSFQSRLFSSCGYLNLSITELTIGRPFESVFYPFDIIDSPSESKKKIDYSYGLFCSHSYFNDEEDIEWLDISDKDYELMVQNFKCAQFVWNDGQEFFYEDSQDQFLNQIDFESHEIATDSSSSASSDSSNSIALDSSVSSDSSSYIASENPISLESRLRKIKPGVRNRKKINRNLDSCHVINSQSVAQVSTPDINENHEELISSMPATESVKFNEQAVVEVALPSDEVLVASALNATQERIEQVVTAVVSRSPRRKRRARAHQVVQNEVDPDIAFLDSVIRGNWINWCQIVADLTGEMFSEGVRGGVGGIFSQDFYVDEYKLLRLFNLAIEGLDSDASGSGYCFDTATAPLIMYFKNYIKDDVWISDNIDNALHYYYEIAKKNHEIFTADRSCAQFKHAKQAVHNCIIMTRKASLIQERRNHSA